MNSKILTLVVLSIFSGSVHEQPVPPIHIPPKPKLTGLPAYVHHAAKVSGLPPKLIEAVIHVESRGHLKVVSSAGAIGPMQLEPVTAKFLHVNPWNPKQNVVGGAKYLEQLIKRFGSLWLALEAFNTGPTNVADGRVCHAAVSYANNVIRYESTES